ncbi:hypothetical protein BpHYR1_026155 [Brachionus plicatilis]|uniref:Uncharacterized protein n=1 Tax=Brachionus plicatilis TaxID=10195 RepID=A0A3M7T791_BRAPC|nr:hypothetical protein BpHYR1_026155 [Brachionus plicatilis]
MDSQDTNFVNPMVELLENQDFINDEEKSDSDLEIKKRNILILSDKKKLEEKSKNKLDYCNTDIEVEFSIKNKDESRNTANFFLYGDKDNVNFRSKVLPNVQIEVNRTFRSDSNANEDTDVKMNIYEQTIITGSENNKDEERFICSKKLFTGINDPSQHSDFYEPEVKKISFSLFNLESVTK